MRHAPSSPAIPVVVLACALGGASGVASPADEAAAGLSPATVAAIARLQAQAQDSATAGRRLYLALNCYGCHGLGATGSIGPDIVGASHGAVEFNVLNGNAGGMPSFAAYVTENDIDNITSYLGSIGTQLEPKFVDWWRKNPRK